MPGFLTTVLAASTMWHPASGALWTSVCARGEVRHPRPEGHFGHDEVGDLRIGMSPVAKRMNK